MPNTETEMLSVEQATAEFVSRLIKDLSISTRSSRLRKSTCEIDAPDRTRGDSTYQILRLSPLTDLSPSFTELDGSFRARSTVRICAATREEFEDLYHERRAELLQSIVAAAYAQGKKDTRKAILDALGVEQHV